MNKQDLDNLVKIGRIKEEPASRAEYDGMLSAAKMRLRDAQNEDLDPDSQFDLAYGAAHRLPSAALRREGYRSENRITVFQTLVPTLGTNNADIQIFIKAHNERNLAEYGGASRSTKLFSPISSVAPRHWRSGLGARSAARTQTGRPRSIGPQSVG